MTGRHPSICSLTVWVAAGAAPARAKRRDYTVSFEEDNREDQKVPIGASTRVGQSHLQNIDAGAFRQNRR
jgi:hypothetical protein